MPRSNEALLRMAGIALPLLLGAVGAHSVLKPPKDTPSLSASVPSAEDLDLLQKYLTPAPINGVPAITGAAGMSIDGPDPFASTDYSSAEVAGSVAPLPVRERNIVSAILISNDRRVAVIDETLVSVGSMLPGGFRVTRIEKDHIEIVTPGGVRRMLAIRNSNDP